MRKYGFTMTEMVVAMFILSIVMLCGGRMIRVPDLREEYRCRQFFSKVRSVFIKSRLSAASYDRRYTMIFIDGNGILYYKTGSVTRGITHEDHGFTVCVEGRDGLASTINSSPNFKITDFSTGNTSFTMLVRRYGKTIGKFIIQVGTCAVREEYYGYQ